MDQGKGADRQVQIHLQVQDSGFRGLKTTGQPGTDCGTGLVYPDIAEEGKWTQVDETAGKSLRASVG